MPNTPTDLAHPWEPADGPRQRSNGRVVVVGVVLALAGSTLAAAREPVPRAPAPAPWTAPFGVSPAQPRPHEAAVAIDRDGTTAVTWIVIPFGSQSPRSGLWLRLRQADGTWLPARHLDPDALHSPSIVADPDGGFTIGYGRDEPYSVTVASDGTLGVPEALDDGRLVHYDTRGRPGINLGTSPDGTLTAAWVSVQSQPRVRRVMVAQRPPGEQWQPASYLSRAGSMATESALAVTSTGAVVVAWRNRTLGTNRVRVVARTYEVGDTWSIPAPLSDRRIRVADDVRAAPGPGDTAYVSWAHHGSAGDLLRYAVRRGPGDWTGPRNIPARGRDAPLFAGSGGRVLRVWAATARRSAFTHLMAQVRTLGGRWRPPVQLTPLDRPLEKITVHGDGTGRFRVVAETQPTKVGDMTSFRIKTSR